MAEWGIKVSQENQNVNTCQDKDLVFSSDWNTFKIIERKSANLFVANGTNSSYTFTHSYGMVMALVFVDLADNKYSFSEASNRVSEGHWNGCYTEISNNQVKVDIYNRGGIDKFFHIYCFLFRESI